MAALYSITSACTRRFGARAFGKKNCATLPTPMGSTANGTGRGNFRRLLSGFSRIIKSSVENRQLIIPSTKFEFHTKTDLEKRFRIITLGIIQAKIRQIYAEFRAPTGEKTDIRTEIIEQP